MNLEKPIKLKKTFELDSVKMLDMIGEEQLPTLQLSGYASRGYTDNGMRAIDLDGETINQYGIDVSRLETKNIPLLFQHDQSKIVGKVISAAYDSKGLYVTAQLTKLPGDSLTNYVYEAVKAGMLNSFSVGLMVEDIDMVDQDEDSYLEITKSHLFELSVVSTPALAVATFSTQVIKSADGVSAKTIIARDALKADNDDLCNSLGCLMKNATAKKELPVDKIKVKEVETPAEPEVKPEVEPEVETEVEPEVEPVKEEEPVAEPVAEPEPTKEEEPVAEPVVETKEEEAPSKTSEEQEPKENESTSNIEEEVQVSEPAAVTIEAAIEFLSGIDIETLPEDDLERVYEIVSTLADAVEAKVVEELAAEYLANQ